MITDRIAFQRQLKRGYTWKLTREGKLELTQWVDTGTQPPQEPITIEIDRVGQYSLASFLLRVLRHRRKEKK